MTDFGRRLPFHKATHGDGGSDEIDATGLVGRINYVDRGDPSTIDFSKLDITCDTTWYDLDLSSIVPDGAVAVSLVVLLLDNASNSYIRFRKNGNVHEHNFVTLRTQVSMVYVAQHFTVSCDSDRIIEYAASALSFTVIAITVAGWYI